MPLPCLFLGDVVWKILATLKCDLRNSINQSWFDLRNWTLKFEGPYFRKIVAVRASNYPRCAVLVCFLFVFVSLCNICSKDVQQRVVNWTYLFDLLPPASAIAGWKMDHERMNLTPPSHFGVLSVVMNRPLPVVGLPMIIAYKWYVLYCSLLAIPD